MFITDLLLGFQFEPQKILFQKLSQILFISNKAVIYPIVFGSVIDFCVKKLIFIFALTNNMISLFFWVYTKLRKSKLGLWLIFAYSSFCSKYPIFLGILYFLFKSTFCSQIN